MQKTWEIDFNVIGPLTITSPIPSFREKKGFDKNQFYSDISLRPTSSGFKATITAYADTLETAETVAYIYFGKMRDILSLNNDIPIQINTEEGWFDNNKKFTSRRRLSQEDLSLAFKMARVLEKEQPLLLRAIGWYSKGKLSHNTFDQFTAFFNVLEIVSNNYHTPNERTKIGVKNRIYQCFIENFGKTNDWDLPNKWIDDMYEKRNAIYHGGEDINLESIKETAELISLIQDTSRKLINSIINKEYPSNYFEMQNLLDLF